MEKDERVAWLIVRAGLLLIALVFTIYLFVKPECGIDNEFLACRVTGTLGDIIGLAMFYAGLLWTSGIVKGISNLSNPPGSSKWNYVLFLVLVFGVIIFWNL